MIAALLLLPLAALATPVRLAVLHSGLSRDGPGLLLRDIRRSDADILAIRDVIVAMRPDVLLLLRFDYDLDAAALRAFAALLDEGGHTMPHHFAWRPNTGMATGLDMVGDGRTGTADDAQGFGRYAGAGGMAILSRLPVVSSHAHDYSAFLWRDLPDALIPQRDGAAFPSDEVFAVQRLSSTGHWRVPVLLPDGRHLTLLAWHSGPPVFGGPLARNRRRNHDETAFWLHLLNGALPFPPPEPPFVLLGNSNLDPEHGDGIHAAMQALLSHPALQDPRPVGRRPGTEADSAATAYWPDGPGALRVSYILPDSTITVSDSGLVWPPLPARHAMVWTDLMPQGP
ncbi:MAG: endonuclease/exonuclease/phosphatase family protein [Pararhodobacter sp.]|nr:endonuclease/exonuclease/phosphatase family protein [Pararhodobacter sp.]